MSKAKAVAIADTCFLIDWARWRRRDAIFGVFRFVFVPESVLDEVVSETTIAWIANGLAAGSLALFTETADVVEEARRLVERSRRIPGMRGVDLPEAVCLCVGRRKGYVVLTENRGALMTVELMEEYRGVTVWRALEVIGEALRRGVISAGNPLAVFREYEEDTRHIFPRRDLERVVRELGGEAQEVG